MTDKKNETQTATGLTGTQMADLIGVDPKNFRRFLRESERAAAKAEGRDPNLPGSGRKYAFSAAHADAWAAAYASHSSASGRVIMGAPPVTDEAV